MRAKTSTNWLVTTNGLSSTARTTNIHMTCFYKVVELKKTGYNQLEKNRFNIDSSSKRFSTKLRGNGRTMQLGCFLRQVN